LHFIPARNSTPHRLENMGQINGGNHENGPFIEVSYLSAGNGERAKCEIRFIHS
jgi:hypothetical protein